MVEPHAHHKGGEISGELLANLLVIPNGHGITDIDELFKPIEPQSGADDGGVDGRRLVHMEELFVHAPNETARKAREAVSRNGSDPSRTLARTDIIMNGVGITRIDELFKPIEVPAHGSSDERAKEVDSAYRQLAKITGAPVDAVTPYRFDAKKQTADGPDSVVDPVAIRMIRLKKARTAQTPLTLRPGRRVKDNTLMEVESERRDFHIGIRRAKRMAERFGQSVTGAARDYREKASWRRGRAPSKKHVVRKLPKEALLAIQS